ncbi:MAG: AAA family ATPase [Chloroflexota bacterium]
MRVKSLSLKNIGPFIDADLEFFTDADEKPPVVLITGENGTGKSIILDAIRGVFGGSYATLERSLPRYNVTQRANIKLGIELEGFETELESNSFIKRSSDHYEVGLSPSEQNLGQELRFLPSRLEQGLVEAPNWLVDYWPSLLATGSYNVQSLISPKHEKYLSQSLQGKKAKDNITQLICHFDYLRDSRDKNEQAMGKILYRFLEEIVASGLLEGGRLSHVARATYEPMIFQNGQIIGLESLSSGNSYLIQNLVDLLSRMYAVHFLRKTPLSELGKTPGLLLIDEAENQLHPKWQKRFVKTILRLFPNLQIIATTHSPFIISSVPNARLFVCKSRGDHCVVVDETAEYSNKPVDEILMSPLFEETQPFNEEITQLLERREVAIVANDIGLQEQIEGQLKQLNPEAFSYFDVDKMIQSLANGGS